MDDEEERGIHNGNVPNLASVHNTSALLVSEHDTLKYHLLGPSLTKAGQDSVDQQKVSEIIYNASKGSKFFNNEENKDRNLTQKINRILALKRQLDKLDLTSYLRRADEYIASLELARDLSQVVVHIDCDAFYAAVEELDHPELRDVPMAVGKGVLTTCNYHARKFGCRSGMAGFVAMKLCPDLICLPLNFDKYIAKAQEVRQVLAEYDPRFESASIDEAYLNITEYCAQTQKDPREVVSQLRAEVFEKAKITISAGIAANGKLAKICSNKNKPNGQFYLPSNRNAIMAFMRDLPTRKVNGIGRVFERELDAIGIKTCGQIYPQRAYLSKLFGEKAFHFLMNCYLGLGRTQVQPAEEHERKSVGTESTFRDITATAELHDKLRWIANELEKDMKRTEFKGRTLVLKIKLHTYEVLTRQTIPPKAIYLAEDLYKYSLPMLTRLQAERPGMTLRLMGLRMTHLVSTKKDNSDFFQIGRKKGDVCPANTTISNGEESAASDDIWEVWPEAEFEEAARQERQDDMDEVEALSQKHTMDEFHKSTDMAEASLTLDKSWSRRHGKEVSSNPSPRAGTFQRQELEEDCRWNCPVCGSSQVANDRAFNEHIDFCISKKAIQRAVEDTISRSESDLKPANGLQNKSRNSKKRSRPLKELQVSAERSARIKGFFS